MNRGNAPRALWLAALTSAALVAGSGVALAGDIRETVRAALASNPEVGVVRADRRAVDQELRQARALYFPSIDLRAAAGPEWSNNNTTRNRPGRGPGDSASRTLFRTESQLTLTQLLFDGFATDSEIARQTARVDSASYRVEEAGEFVAADAIEAHLDVLRNQRIVELTEANIEAHRKLLDQVSELERSGAGGIADVRQAEARLAAAQASLADAQGNLGDAIAAYRAVVGEAPAALDDAATPVSALPASADESASIASTQNPTVKIAMSDVAVSQAELRGSRSGFYPEVDLEVSGSANDNIDGAEGSSVDAQALVVLNYNLFRGGGDVAREREAFHRVNEARANLRQARLEAERQARVSYNALTRQRGRLEALRAQQEANRRTRDAYAQEFQLGQRSLLDVLDSENELFVSRVSVVSAEFAEKFAAYRLLAVNGELLDTLDIERPTEEVDIFRSNGETATPERIDSFSREIVDPRATPRPLRGEERGEAPREVQDHQVVVGDAGSVPAYASFDEMTRSVFGAPTDGQDVGGLQPGESDYDSFEAFLDGAFGGGSGGGSPQPAPAPSTASDAAPVSYENFDAFLEGVFGDDAPEQRPQPRQQPHSSEMDQLLDDVFSDLEPSAGPAQQAPEAADAQAAAEPEKSEELTFDRVFASLRRALPW